MRAVFPILGLIGLSFVTATIGSFLPALRALRVDPLTVMRSE